MADKKKAGGKPASGRARKPGPASRTSSGRKGGSVSGPRAKKTPGAKPGSRAAAPSAGKVAKPGKPGRPVKKALTRGRRRAAASPVTALEALLPGPPGLSEEDTIRSAKFTPRSL